MVEAVPSTENGLWVVSPDGRMETTWRINPAARWHDGTPLTSDDLQFTVAVYKDRDIGVAPVAGVQLIDSVEPLNPQTAVVKWREPFISADAQFSAGSAMWVLPRHILESPFQENKDQFLSLPYWQGEF